MFWDELGASPKKCLPFLHPINIYCAVYCILPLRLLQAGGNHSRLPLYI